MRDRVAERRSCRPCCDRAGTIGAPGWAGAASRDQRVEVGDRIVDAGRSAPAARLSGRGRGGRARRPHSPRRSAARRRGRSGRCARRRRGRSPRPPVAARSGSQACQKMRSAADAGEPARRGARPASRRPPRPTARRRRPRGASRGRRRIPPARCRRRSPARASPAAARRRDRRGSSSQLLLEAVAPPHPQRAREHVHGALAALVVVRARLRARRDPEHAPCRCCCAPAVACEISEPPTTPRGTSRSAPGLTTFIGRRLHHRARVYRRSRRRRPRSGAAAAAPPRGRPAGSCGGRRSAPRASAGAARRTLVAVVSGAHDDVRRERRKPGGDLPDVQVVDLDDARLRGERVADLVRVEAGRGRLHEHPARGLQQPEGRVQHQRRDQQRGDRVARARSRWPGSRPPRPRWREPVEVGEDVPVGALDVEAALRSCRRGQDPRREPG